MPMVGRRRSCLQRAVSGPTVASIGRVRYEVGGSSSVIYCFTAASLPLAMSCMLSAMLIISVLLGLLGASSASTLPQGGEEVRACGEADYYPSRVRFLQSSVTTRWLTMGN